MPDRNRALARLSGPEIAGPELRDWRERHGVGRTTLAGELGIEASYLEHLEAGRKSPSLGLAFRIQDRTGVVASRWLSTEPHLSEDLPDVPQAAAAAGGRR